MRRPATIPRKFPGPIFSRIRCSPHGSRTPPRLRATRAHSISAAGLATTRRRSRHKGWRVTGFDLSARAIAWAKPRFPELDLVAADLFQPPAAWDRAFDLVHECYTLQALPDAPRAEAMRQIARFVRPGGTLLVIARAREGTGPASGPPWPLTRDELMRFTIHGLRAEAIEQLPDPSDGKPHWRAAFRG